MPPSNAVLQELSDDPQLSYRINLEMYHELIPKGLIEEGAPFELLDGQIVRKLRNAQRQGSMTIGTEHVLVVKRLALLAPRFPSSGCHLQTQQPVSLNDFNEPEPDAAVIAGKEDDYADDLPNARQVLCVIEVASASLRRDQGYKCDLYAASGIARYIIVNLVDRVVEVYAGLDVKRGGYGQVTHLRNKADVLQIAAAGDQTVAIAVGALLD